MCQSVASAAADGSAASGKPRPAAGHGGNFSKSREIPSMKKPIRKAVLPVAGLGTRFLPATKAVPKEMLTVVDRPVLQHVIDEAREAGIEHFVFVTGRNKSVIEDHFDMAYELEDTLKRRGKEKELAALMPALPAAGGESYTRQQAP